MIISASRRTDIPAFYSSWLMDRLRQGAVTVKNPFNPTQQTYISLEPREVDAIVFWTRNPAPLMTHLAELDERGYRYYFLYTITGYGPPLEKYGPSLEAAVASFQCLSNRIGRSRVIWRFDPIMFIEGNGTSAVTSRFEHIARSLSGYTDRVIISFLDIYKKVSRRLNCLEKEHGIKIIDVSRQPEQIGPLAANLASRADDNGMEIQSCAEKVNMEPYGIMPGSCIDAMLMNKLFGLAVPPAKDKSQRPACRCAPSRDIGTYNTCRHGCVYCYATDSVP